MRRRRSKSVQPGVSLFPFLAVLICTLGVLIVLLVLAVQSASVKKADLENDIATRKAEELADRLATQKQRDEIIARLEDDIDRRILEAEGFEEARPESRRQLAAARDYRAHLEKELAEIEEQARQLTAEMKLLDADDEAAPATVEPDELQLLRQKIERTEAELAEKRNNIQVIEQKKYAIVPYHGSGGTQRIPVFVECDRHGLLLQPWGIRVKREDFFYPVAAGNPVDAALTAVRNYYQKHELAARDKRPYPLLVVRPDGAQTWGLARQSLLSWDDEFGYELVSQQMELDFGTIDPQLKEEIQQAVNKSKKTQLALKRRRGALAAGGRPGSQPGGKPSSGFGPRRRLNSLEEVASLKSSADTGGESPHRQVAYEKTAHEKTAGKEAVSNIASNFTADTASSAAQISAEDAAAASSGPQASGQRSPHQSLALTRGANWALPTQTGGGTGYVRPVGLVCSGDSLSLKSVSGKTVTIAFGEQPQQAIDRMVNVIWQRIDAWGIAGANAFWKPELAVTVAPGGRDRFLLIQRLLGGSGLGIEEVSR